MVWIMGKWARLLDTERRVWDEMGWDEMGWDEMGWDEMGWDEMG